MLLSCAVLLLEPPSPRLISIRPELSNANVPPLWLVADGCGMVRIASAVDVSACAKLLASVWYLRISVDVGAARVEVQIEGPVGDEVRREGDGRAGLSRRPC